jgi:hypothetical protein
MAAVIRVVRALVISLALLAAQHSALAHQFWHSAVQSSPLTAADEGQDHGNSLLCELHAALGTVLGGLSGMQVPALLCDLSGTAFAALACPAPCVRGPAPAARDPPPLL